MSKAKEKKEVTTNQGKKHLFGSSEKSDFILNMSAESAQKLCEEAAVAEEAEA